MRTEEEIKEQRDKAESGEDYPGMTYQDGVKEALDWVLEDQEDTPYE